MTLTPLFLLAQAVTTAAPGTADASPASLFRNFIPLIFICVLFYFLLIRPQQKQRKQLEQLASSIKTGDNVVTSSGIHGIVANVKDKTVLVKVADNVKIEFDRSAIVAIDRAESASVEVVKS